MAMGRTSPPTERADPLRATSRRLVGRDHVLEDLASRYADSPTVDGVDTVVLEGPAGIGKTRTVAALAESVRTSQGCVLVGHCVHLGEVVLPYAPLVEMVEALVDQAGTTAVRSWAGAAAPELARLVPALADPADAAGPAGHAVPDPATAASSARLFQALRGVLDGAATRRPLLLVVEDVQWADRSTLEMLSVLVPQLSGPGVLVVTQRTDERPSDPRLRGLRAQLAPRSSQRVSLPALTREQQAQQLSDILGVPPSPSLLDSVFARAEGNPFFAEELLALGDSRELPDGVRDLLVSRLESLSAQGQQVLRAAAVVGRRAPHRLLEAVVDVSAERLEDELRRACDEHLLVRDGGTEPGVRFRHALLQEAVAATLLPGEAVRLHRRVAEALTERPGLVGSEGAVAGRLARHWHAAATPDRALVSSVEAARAAKDALAFAESLAHYERAVELLPAVAAPDDLLDVPRHWLLWSAAEVAHLAAEPLRAAELVRAAIAEVPPDAPHHHAYLHERLGRYLWMCADGQGSLAAYERAVDVVPPEPTRWRAAALSGYSQILMLASRWEESERYAREAIDVATASGARALEGHARCNLGVDLAMLGQVDAGIAELGLAERIAEEEMEDVDDIARARVNLHTVLMEAGRFAEAAAVGERSIEVVADLGLARRKGVWCRCDLATTLIATGRHVEARARLLEAETLGPSGVDRVATDIQLGTLDARTGHLAAARERLENLLDRHAARLLDPQLIGPLFEALVEVTTWQGDPAAARAFARRGRERLAAVTHPGHVVPLLVAAVRATVEDALQRRGRASVTPELLQDARALVHHAETLLRTTSSRSPVHDALLGEARAELGRLDPGEGDGWVAVAGRWSTLGVPYRAAYATLRAAEGAFRARHRAEAQRLLGQAWQAAHDLGSSHLVEVAERLADRAGVALQPETLGATAASAYRLTRREQEVLGLVARGFADREIAAQLFISHRTVERHVSNLLAKLDAARRAELVAVAVREGLVPPGER